MKIKVLDAANKDLINGYNFYEKIEAGLGSYFLDTLFSDIDSLRIYGGIHPVCFGGYHRLLSKRFPFAVYYKKMDDVIYVFAVLDCRQNPDGISRRFK